MRGITPYMIGATLVLAACELQSGAVAKSDQSVIKPTYLSVDTRKMDETLVNFVVRIENPRSGGDIEDYAQCAAAQYTLIRGFGFAQRIKTEITQETEGSGIWVGDSVYTLSNAHPGSRHTVDAEVTADNCIANRIPMG